RSMRWGKAGPLTDPSVRRSWEKPGRAEFRKEEMENPVAFLQAFKFEFMREFSFGDVSRMAWARALNYFNERLSRLYAGLFEEAIAFLNDNQGRFFDSNGLVCEIKVD